MARRYLWFIWLIVVFFCVSIVHDKFSDRSNALALDVGGIISTDTTFMLADSPVNVNLSVIVNEGVTLTIEPGVEIRFAENTSLQVDGELIARGTNAQPITFTIDPNSFGNWGQILFTSTAASAVFDNNGNYQSGFILEFCTVGNGGAAGDGAVESESGAPFIANCTINNNNIGVNLTGTIPDVVRLTSNTISDNSSNGISISSFESATIENNTITDNSESGVSISTTTNATITGNTIMGNNSASSNGGGILLISITSVSIADNIISNNRII